MKNKIFIIPLFFLLFSCSSICRKSNSINESFINTDRYDNQPCFASLPIMLINNVYPCFQVNNSIFLLDTGSSTSVITMEGVQDLFPESYDAMKFEAQNLPNNGNLEKTITSIGSININSQNSESIEIPLFLTNYCNFSFEGMISQDCFRKFSNIIFDFKNNYIVFDGQKIDGKEIPMKIDDDGLCFIEFKLNGKKELGLIDTGGDSFLLRSSLYTKKCNMNVLDLHQIELLKNTKIEITPPKNIKIHTLKIGNIKYSNFEALLSSDSRIIMTDEARGRTSEYSVLGFPLFRNMIIQFDYKNSIFRIKY